MSKTYRAYEPEQLLLLPPSLKDWLEPGHLAHFVSSVVETLDLSPILGVYEAEERGYPPYHPVMLVKVLVYGYCVGVPSSRKIARRLEEDVAFRMLAANNRPDFRTIADFRQRHLLALDGLFLSVLGLCQEAGLVRLGHVSLDGTKMKANASKHKAMSYARMTEEEKRLREIVRKLLQEAEDVDRREDELYGPDKRGDELPEELRDPVKRLRRIQEAKAAIEKRAREAAEAKKKADAEKRVDGPLQGPVPKEPNATPSPKTQRNFTDPESRIMPSSSEKGSFLQGYNCQAAVDGEHQIIVAADVAQDTTDRRQGARMVGQVVENLGAAPREASMDAGYFNDAVVGILGELGCEAYIAPEKRRHRDEVPPAPRGRIPNGLTLTERMRRKLSTKRGRTAYGRRKEIVEPVFGQIKQGRGFRQFLLRGLEKVKGEWSLICTGHNLLKLWRALGTGPPRFANAH